MEVPGEMQYVPVYCLTAQTVACTKLGIIRDPLAAKLDIDDVFDGRRPCLLDYMLYAADAGDDEVTHVASLGKKGVTSTVDEWGCEYHRKCKVVEIITPDVVIRQNAVRSRNPDVYSNRTRGDAYARVFSNVLVEASDDDSAQPSEGSCGESGHSWDLEYESGQEPDQLATEPNVWQKQFHMKEDDRMDMSKTVRGRIDTGGYVVFVRKSENHASTIWRGREQMKFTNRQLEGQGTLDFATV